MMYDLVFNYCEYDSLIVKLIVTLSVSVGLRVSLSVTVSEYGLYQYRCHFIIHIDIVLCLLIIDIQ